MSLEIAEIDTPEDRIFRAYAYIDAGLSVMAAFHAAQAAGEPMISSDQALEAHGVDRIALEPGEPA